MTFRYLGHPLYADENEEHKSTYNKWFQRQFGKRVPIHIFGSGSEGNSVYLKPHKLLIDIGLPYKEYMDYDPTFFLDVDYIVVTHHHGDHLNPSTLRRALRLHPHLRVITTQFMWDYIQRGCFKPTYIKRKPGEPVPFGHDPEYMTDADGNRLTEPNKWVNDFGEHYSKFLLIPSYPTDEQPFYYNLKAHTGHEYTFEPLTVKHGDIVNLAVQINDPSLDFNFLYASDLDNLDGERSFIDCFGEKQFVTGLNQSREYTCMFLEANYDEPTLQAWYDALSREDPDYYNKKARADGNLRHISEQDAQPYVEKFLHEDGIFIPLHASKTFGTLHQG